MMTLSNILSHIKITEAVGSTSIPITSVDFDSRKVREGALFVATIGTQVDGHEFITQAIDSGAIAIVCETLPKELRENVSYIKVKNSQEALGQIASNWYDQPSSKIKLIGVTGTNGKTTIATLLHQTFSNLGYYCGLLSTIETKSDHKSFLPPTLHQML